MNLIEKFHQKIQKDFPQLKTSLRIPRDKENGMYWLDIEPYLIIQWSSTKGFGLSRMNIEHGIGEKPEEVFTNEQYELMSCLTSCYLYEFERYKKLNPGFK